MFYNTAYFMVLCGESMLSNKLKIICSVKVFKLEFVSLPIADQLQSSVEQDCKTRLKKYYVLCDVKCP